MNAYTAILAAPKKEVVPMAPYLSKTPVIPQRQTLAESAVHVLIEQMDAGRWSGFLPGERLLCEELQISRPTLRQALKILESEGRLETEQGRRRRITGRRKAGIPAARKHIISVLSPLPLKALPPFVLFWVDEVRSSLAKCGYQLEFHHSRACASQKPERALDRLIHSTPSALWILLLSAPPVQKWFAARNIPCLIAGSCSADMTLPSVDIDYHAACRHAAGVFRRAGHTHLALVIPADGLIGDEESESGFLEGAEKGAPPLVLRHDGTREDIIRQVENSLRLNAPPTGFLVARSAHALTVLSLLMKRGIRLPKEASVISRDDDAFLEFVTPKVARYNSNPEKFARQISHIVLQMARSGPAPDHPVRLMPHFQAGETA